MFFIYIIYSISRDKYYVGFTSNIKERIEDHNTNHNGFTGKTGDWQLKWHEVTDEKSKALKREKQIKAWKSRAMIEKLMACK